MPSLGLCEQLSCWGGVPTSLPAWLVIGTSGKEVLASPETPRPVMAVGLVCVCGGSGVCISDLWRCSASQWMVKKSMW